MQHSESRVVPYPADLMYRVVADIEHYPQFLPWILTSKIVRRDGNRVSVAMTLGLKLLSQRFSSEAILDPPHAIKITSNDAPFEYFEQHWRFDEDGSGTVVSYSFDFRLRSPLLAAIPGMLFDQSVRSTVDAFVARARSVYGTTPSPSTLQRPPPDSVTLPTDAPKG